MSRHFFRDFNLIHQRLLDLFGLVEKMVNNSVHAFHERRFELASEVINEDHLVDQVEVLIEEDCLKILALYQPVAVELRRLTTMMKINAELERIADLACNIAERALAMRIYPDYQSPPQLLDIAEKGMALVARSLDSFVNLDTEAAHLVIEQDSEVDELFREVIAELTSAMKLEGAEIEPALNCFSVGKHLERIGDHAVTIAEDVIYLVDGDIIRHRNNKESQSETT